MGKDMLFLLKQWTMKKLDQIKYKKWVKSEY